MADNEPLYIERQLSRYDSLEDHEANGYMTAIHSLKSRISVKCNGMRYCYTILGLLSVLSLISTFTFWAIASTVYEPGDIPKDLITSTPRPNETVLLLKINPFYVENVTIASGNNNFDIKQLKCNEVSTKSNEVNMNDSFQLQNNTDGHGQELGTFYLAEGSKLTFNLNITYTSNENGTLNIKAAIFTNKDKFDDFLEGDRVRKKKMFAFHQITKPVYNFTLDANDARYYFIGLYVPADSNIEEVEYEIQGSATQYDIEWAEPTCIIRPQNGTANCTRTFKNPHLNSKDNDICIFGRTLDNGTSTQIELQSINGNEYVNRISFVLEELSLGVCATVMVTNMIIVITIYFAQIVYW